MSSFRGACGQSRTGALTSSRARGEHLEAFLAALRGGATARARASTAAPPQTRAEGLFSHHGVVRVAGEQRTQVEQGGRMQAKERASRACHMCQRSGCAAGAARRTAPSASAHEFGRFRAFQTSTSGPEILVASLFSALVVCFGCFRCSTTSYNQNKQPAL